MAKINKPLNRKCHGLWQFQFIRGVNRNKPLRKVHYINSKQNGLLVGTEINGIKYCFYKNDIKIGYELGKKHQCLYKQGKILGEHIKWRK